jgi:hypothetical protein
VDTVVEAYRKGELSSKIKEINKEGKLKGLSRDILNAWIFDRRHGFAQAGLPETVTGVRTLLEWKGVIDPKKRYTVERIANAIEDHETAHNGASPTRKSGVIPDGDLKGERWDRIDTAIRVRGRGLEKEAIPEGVTGLEKFVPWKKTGLIPGPRPALRVQDIIEAREAYRKAHDGKDPGQYGGDIKGENLALDGDNWANINAALKPLNKGGKRGRGLEAENLPAPVKSLATLFKWWDETHPAPGSDSTPEPGF